MPNCPICLEDSTAIKEVHDGRAIVHLSCGHRGKRNPDIGLALEWETREVFDPSIGTVIKRRLPKEIDRRELLALDEDLIPEIVPESTIDSSLLKEDGEEDPSEEELLVSLEPVETKKKRTK